MMKKINGKSSDILGKIQKTLINISKIPTQCSLLTLKTIRRDDLELRVDARNRVRLFFKGVELTKSSGFNSLVLFDGIWHSLSESRVKTRKIAQDKIALFIKFRNMPLIQHWLIELGPCSQINWNIEIEVEKTLRIDAVKAVAFFSKYYGTWFNAKAQENRFPHFTEGQKICYETKGLDFIGLKARDPQIPSLAFKADGFPFTVAIQNTDLDLSSRVFEIQFEEEKELYQPGIYPYLKASFQLYPDKAVLEDTLIKIRQEQERKRQEEEKKKQEEERTRQEDERKKQEEERKRQERKKQEEEKRLKEEDEKLSTFKKGPIRLYLDIHNRFHIYYKDNEITKGMGLNAGIFSEGNWYGSSDSQIKVEKPSSDEMLFYFTHNKLPVVQTWHLRFLTEGIMEWEVRMRIKEPLRIDRRNASLFLSKAYEGWIMPPEEGKFPSGFGPEWLRMCASYVNKPDFAGLYSSMADLPDITLKNPKDSKCSFLIQNTDLDLSSRVFEIQFEEEKELYQPGIYPYLKASFQLYPDKAVLEDILIKIRQKEERKRQEQERIRQEEERKKQEEEKKRQEEERKRLEEQERKRQEQERIRQEEEKKRQEEERKRSEEQERKRQEEERIRQEQEQKRQEDERKRQEREWKKHEEKIKRLQEKIKKAYVRPGETIELVTLKQSYIKNDDSVYIYGDNEELHNRISSRKGDFKKIISKIKSGINKNIKIGISRFNFFKLNEIAQFCSSLMGRRLDLRSVALNPLPLKRLYLNFFDYIKELNARIGSDRIEFFLKDEKLLDLLYAVSSQANQYNERELLRLLGVISEHAFIGPQTIVLDTYHRCNANCIHCWIHTPRRKLSPELINLKMDFSLYKNIVDDAAGLLCDEIIIQGDGEPLLDNRFLEMVQYARDRGLKVIFFTNAVLLDKKKAERITELEIDEIYCSLPAGTDKTYAVINSKQSKETFHKITHNLKNFISLRDRLKRNKPLLQMTHVIHDLNHHELEEMARLDAYIGADKARFYLARLDENIKFLKIKPAHIETIKKSLRKVTSCLKKERIELQDNIWFQLENYNCKTGGWSGSKFLKSGCPVGWFFCLILAKGELSMCCHLRVVDYLGDKSFKEAWNSGAYNKFRIQAKYIMKNKDITFRNGLKLYDQYCNNCDTHQVILRINELLKKYDLKQFYTYKGTVI